MHKRVFLAALVAAAAVVCPAQATLSTTNSTISYASNGVTVAFTVPYKFLNSSHLVVQKTVSSVTTTLVLGTDYSVTGAGSSSGGTVTLNVAVANGGTVKISRSTPRRQDTSLRTFPISTSGKTVEDALDYRTMVEQEMNDGTFTQLLATPVTTAQATTAAPSTVPNSSNTNTAGSSSAFPRADHVHQCATPTATQKGCITTQPFAAANTAAGQSIANTTVTIVVFGTVELDTDAAYNSGTGRYTVPTGKGGRYAIQSSIMWNASAGTSSLVSIYKNAGILKTTQILTSGAGTSEAVAATVNLAAGDIVDIRVQQNSGGAVTLSAVATNNWLSIAKLPD